MAFWKNLFSNEKKFDISKCVINRPAIQQSVIEAVQSDNTNAICVYGKTGVGKTVTVRSVLNNYTSNNKNAKHIYCRVAKGYTPLDILITLRNKLVENYGHTFETFDKAYNIYCDKTGTYYKKLENKQTTKKGILYDAAITFAETFTDSQPLIECIIKLTTEVAEELTVINKIIKCVQTYCELKDKYEEKNVLDDNEAAMQVYDEVKPEILYESFPYIFAEDLKNTLSNDLLVIFLDDYDNILCDNEEIEEDVWFKGEDGLIFKCGKVFWVLSAHQKLNFDEENMALQEKLTYKQVTEFTFEETVDYLKKAGITDTSVVDLIYKETKGNPGELKNAVIMYNECKKSMQGTNFDYYQLLEAYLNKQDDNIKKLVNTACVLQTWSYDILKVFEPQIKNVAVYKRFVNSPFVKCLDYKDTDIIEDDNAYYVIVDKMEALLDEKALCKIRNNILEKIREPKFKNLLTDPVSNEYGQIVRWLIDFGYSVFKKEQQLYKAQDNKKVMVKPKVRFANFLKDNVYEYIGVQNDEFLSTYFYNIKKEIYYLCSVLEQDDVGMDGELCKVLKPVVEYCAKQMGDNHMDVMDLRNKLIKACEKVCEKYKGYLRNKEITVKKKEEYRAFYQEHWKIVAEQSFKIYQCSDNAYRKRNALKQYAYANSRLGNYREALMCYYQLNQKWYRDTKFVESVKKAIDYNYKAYEKDYPCTCVLCQADMENTVNALKYSVEHWGMAICFDCQPNRGKNAKVQDAETAKTVVKTIKQDNDVIENLKIEAVNLENNICSECKTAIDARVHGYSVKNFGRPLCRDCQEAEKGQNVNARQQAVKESVTQISNGNSAAQTGAIKCSECKTAIDARVHGYSVKNFGRPLCYNCQRKYKK